MEKPWSLTSSSFNVCVSRLVRKITTSQQMKTFGHEWIHVFASSCVQVVCSTDYLYGNFQSRSTSFKCMLTLTVGYTIREIPTRCRLSRNSLILIRPIDQSYSRNRIEGSETLVNFLKCSLFNQKRTRQPIRCRSVEKCS